MKVSVLMMTYNHETYIKEAIEGVLMQLTDFEVELIISDDASTDNTKQVVNKFIEKQEKITIHYHRHSNNLGMYDNFKFAYTQCSGEFIAICEGDDYWTDPLKLQKQVDFLTQNEAYSFTYTRFKVLHQHSLALVNDFNEKHFITNPSHVDFTFETFMNGWHIGNQTLLFRASYFNKQVFDMFPKFKDVHLITQLLKKGKGACLNFYGAVYRMHDGGIHTSVTVYNGYRIGYETHKDIYLDNSSNIYLKNKYLHSFKNFLNANIQQGYLFNAFWMSFKLFFLNWSMIDFLKHIKRILIKAINSWK